MGEAKQAGCERCAALEEQLAEVRRSRDALMLELAEERERANAQRLLREDEAADRISVAGVEGAPLRYLVADRVNDGLKQVLGPVHSGVRNVARGLAIRLERFRR